MVNKHVVLLLFFIGLTSATVNVALNKPASQIDTFGDGTTNYTADRAVDGCFASNATDFSCCSVAVGAFESVSWEVDFGATFLLNQVVIHDRAERATDNQLSGFELYSILAGAESPIYTDTGTGASAGTITVPLEPAINASGLRVKRPNTGLITLCEVMAFAECEDGTYGENCVNTCGQCADGSPCNKTNGVCEAGCQDGWRETTCDERCANETYGANCSGTCGQCSGDDVCNSTDGSCPGDCAAGYTGTMCKTECQNNTYGVNCQEVCGNCINSTQCEVTSGNCTSGCAAGYQGAMCTMNCTSPSFGPDCRDTCNCLNGDECNVVDGTCLGECEAGWSGSSCNIGCENGTYGRNCSSMCGNCLNMAACDVTTGACDVGCDPGWQGSMCTEECSAGFYGANCSSTCGNCLRGEACDNVNGTCPSQCEAGWRGDMCDQECANGTYGLACAMKCFCADGEPCNTTSGECPAGCASGYSGESCHIDLSLARDRPANQSSTRTVDGFAFAASLAVDGDFSQTDPATSRTCSSTEANGTSWWYVDMQNVNSIDNVTVHGPIAANSAELENFNLYLSNVTLTPADLANMDPSYNSTGIDYGTGVYDIAFDPSEVARYVYISLPTTGQSLTLCEVRVFGECPDGTFGTDCGSMCHCADAVPCDKATGRCPAGCAPGWDTVECDEACERGKFGYGCNNDCGSCFDGDVCDHVTGFCDRGCSPGWLDRNCSRACPADSYGQNCTSTCGNCLNGQACNNANGTCAAGCAAGYHGDNCTQGCDDGYFGENCATECGTCVNSTVCNSTTGECALGCADGFETNLCVAALVGGEDSADDDSNLAAILGGVFGALAFIIIVVVIVKCYQARSSDSKTQMQFTSPYANAMSESERGSMSSASSMNEYYGYYNMNTKL